MKSADSLETCEPQRSVEEEIERVRNEGSGRREEGWEERGLCGERTVAGGDALEGVHLVVRGEGGLAVEHLVVEDTWVRVRG